MSELDLKRRGVMLVVSSPSGAGKTTLCDALRQSASDLVMSVSVTTRPPREGELHGRDYYFVSHDEFERMRRDNELLEYASVFGNSYGTPRGPVNEVVARGEDILFDVDWQGAAQLTKSCSGDLVKVFVLPPSAKALEERLLGRGQDSTDVVARRMSEAANEISHWVEYDYIIVNDNLETAKAQLQAILQAERIRKHRLPAMPKYVKDLLKGL